MKRVVVLALAAVALAGCTSSGDPGPTGTRTVVETQTMTSAPPTGSPEQLDFVPALPPGTNRAGERDGACPYLRTGLNIDPTSKPNMADLEGNRIARHTVLTRLRPVGCRFYFQNDYHPTAEIRPTTYPSAAAARAALIATAKAGKNATGYRDFVPDIDGINFQTRFYRADGDDDWAWAFAKGRVLVVVRTDQNKPGTAFNARYVAEAIVGRF